MVLLFAGCLAAGFVLFSGGPVTSGLCDLVYKSPPSSYFSLHKIASQFSGARQAELAWFCPAHGALE